MINGKTLIVIGLILSLVFSSIGWLFADIEFNYELEKCANLDSAESNYDFDITLEKDADYNQDCFRLHNHPLAYFEKVSTNIICSLILALGMMMIARMVTVVIYSYEQSKY